jgi:hypothetical protein
MQKKKGGKMRRRSKQRDGHESWKTTLAFQMVTLLMELVQLRPDDRKTRKKKTLKKHEK